MSALTFSRVSLSLLATLLLPLALWTAEAATAPSKLDVPAVPESVRRVPVLHLGRVKPMAIAAEEIVTAITGYARFGTVSDTPSREGPALKREGSYEPTALLLAWWRAPQAWAAQPLLYAPYLPLQRRLGLRGQWASMDDCRGAWPVLSAAVEQKRRADQSGEVLAWSPTDAAAYQLAQRFVEAQDAFTGRALGLAPLAAGPDARAWLIAHGQSFTPSPDETHPWRGKLVQVFTSANSNGGAPDDALRHADLWLTCEDLMLASDPQLADWPSQIAPMARDFAHALETNQDLNLAALALTITLHDEAPRWQQDVAYPSPALLTVERMYTAARPFTWAWLGFILGGIATAIGLGQAPATGSRDRRAFWKTLGTTLTIAAICFTVAGLGARVAITRLGAVTNLYETLIYVALVVGVLGLVFARVTGNGLYAVAGGIGAGLCAAVGEALPPGMGATLSQLQPVLRSKFWLWTHVKTVVASYAAFVLALVLGNLVLARAAWMRRAVTADESRAIYRALQVGVVLITAGTILGAIWADQAWGRYWGWDPKEVWALVILLTYLIPLHLRYVGVVGPTGLAAWAVFGFMSVVMSWYGVNFLLGAGLHAYAFGSGGQWIVLPLCGAQMALTVVQVVVIKMRSDQAR